MDIISFGLASKQAKRIEKFNANPDSTSGIVTVPKVIASGETITIPAGRIAILPNVQVDGVLNIEGDVFIPSGATTEDLDTRIALKADTTYVDTQVATRGRLVQGTVQNASGTSIDFTGIPSWAKRITVMLNGVSTNGTSSPLLRVGTSGGIISTGYISDTISGQNTVISGSNTTIGVSLVSMGNQATYSYNGAITLGLLSNNLWVIVGTLNIYQVAVCSLSSKINTGSALDRIRITTVNGTDTFDAGQINILVEG